MSNILTYKLSSERGTSGVIRRCKKHATPRIPRRDLRENCSFEPFEGSTRNSTNQDNRTTCLSFGENEIDVIKEFSRFLGTTIANTLFYYRNEIATERYLYSYALLPERYRNYYNNCSARNKKRVFYRSLCTVQLTRINKKRKY